MGQQFVTLITKRRGTSDYQDFITARDRADCHPLTEVPVGGAAAIWGAPMFGAPGVTVVVFGDHTGTFVDGYA
ncbi:MAG: hypothetical protein JOZ49_16935 [Mycolicibacterium sp.]|nr:hypothetical protein [Mycolicibacterium sp.]